jgi:curli biogenesis system outer membrane secretion channel CsgG
MRKIVSLLSAVAFLVLLAPSGRAIASQPSLAVLSFSTQGLTGDWYGNFEPGVAVSDLVTDELVNTNQYNVLDRKSLSNTLQEHQLATSGQVDPATAVRAGRLIGAHFLVAGNIIQFDQTGSSGAAAGSYIPGILGAAVGGYKSTRVTIKVAVHVINVQTGQIVEAFDDEQTQTATSWTGGAVAGYTAGGYENSNFVSSTMGHLIDAEAKAIVAHLDPSRLSMAGSAGPSLTGHIVGVDGSNIILSIGSASHVSVGEFFDVVKVKQLRDPSTGKYMTVNEPVGKVEVTSVNGNSSIASKVSGTIAAGERVQSEQP